MGSEQKENEGGTLRADVDTSAPFESVMEAVTRFGGVGFWKPPTRNQSQPGQVNRLENNQGKVNNQATELQNNPVTTGERETLEILKEIEETKTRFQELKVKLQKEDFEVKTHKSYGQRTKSNTTNEVELSKTEILKRVEEATQEVKDCTRVLEEALIRVNGSRKKSSDFTNSNRKMLVSGRALWIGQILRRKLVVAEENSVKNSVKWKVSLGQIMKRGDHDGEKGVAPKRMKFGFCV